MMVKTDSEDNNINIKSINLYEINFLKRAIRENRSLFIISKSSFVTKLNLQKSAS